MAIKKSIVIKISFFTGVGALALLLLSYFSSKPIDNALVAKEKRRMVKVVKPGDLIFRKGYGLASKIAMNASSHEKVYSHVGVVVAKDENYFVVHAIEDDFKRINGVNQEPLESFLQDGKKFALYRFQRDQKELETFIALAKKLSQQNILYDNDYDSFDASTLYCTEFIVYMMQKSFSDVKVHMTQFLGKNIYSIENIYENRQFLRKVYSSL